MKLVQDLPEIFEEFGEQKRKAFLEVKEYKEKGVPVIGMYCAYFPTELAMAIGAIPVGLCSFSNEVVAAAEREMPKSMCPLVKSSYGFAIEDKCPFFYFADLIIGETTCDGKKKMYELLSEIKHVFVMELPNSQSESGHRFWKTEVVRLKEYLEEYFNIIITDDMIRDAIHLGNAIRLSLKKLCEVMKLEPAPVLGEKIQKIVSGCKYRFDFKTTPAVVDEIRNKILEEYQNGKMLEHRPRILVTGCPIGGDTIKIIKAIEENGGVVVAVENCSGVKTLDQMIDEENPDYYEAIADRYLATGCSIMTPNDNRINLLGNIIDEYHVDGVVEMILSGCHATGAESIYIRKFVNDEKKLPYIAIDTDYSSADYGQISTRTAAFLEMIAAEKDGNEKIDMNRCYSILFLGLAKSKSFEDILKELWSYTKIPMLIINENEECLFSLGITQVEWETSDKCICVNLPENSGKCIGIYPSIQMRTKVKELMELVAKSYSINKLSVNESEKIHPNVKFQTPDFIWILNEKTDTEKTFSDYLGDNFCLIREMGDEFRGYLFSNISGEQDRNELITLCETFSKEQGGAFAVGNGFEQLESSEENKKMLSKMFRMALDKKSRKKVHLLEEYYQELAIDCIIEQVDMKAFQLKELELLKREDKEKCSSLYETVFTYLLMKRNMSQTAATLQIHRNTLSYRINRINELIGLDDKDGIECGKLLLAMQLEKSYEKKQQI